ncbi:unnamed protein product (macronuclear) [Paramecium tetraurelia]|uniref:Uncharacterized protein n=1 Tax=Paramecium tetraurelia TaxID=5888 RepID=A0BGE4_PARTE|nr:uncharacterized protein GSPATT00028646001 [Paramecium tetraurelia]CAK57611.1 unnamed protein product [Paramecium tetraurelia]|eukprot:XP_001425009.1 hypothetical protein (macronuclear) [Paramecium tetraurelia strain d4-2]
MDRQFVNATFSTEAEEIEVNNHGSENSTEIMLSLISALENGLFSYQMLLEARQDILEQWIEKKEINEFLKQDFLINLEYMHNLFDVHAYVNTATYARYVDRYQSNPNYINYDIELPKIKHQILEAEVDWYIENITKDIEMVAKEHCPSFFQPITNQDPLEVRHTRAVINHALQQLESIATKITPINAKYYAKETERYTWCLTGMVPLLPIQEQDPFKQNGIHQRWQKARNIIQHITL